ncbi:glycosyltransferase [Lactobacillus delbrueckii subsp. jakobsenii ZN7a-9 = DSM 26046]|uniref:glycosyltransferase family 2 protein n=1 Tax=Lactobacillus delbrueckii TaxID=1584 RepID=UPI00032F0026|nr:glycosyltransferase family 2 protein [Lactobacillus delbrueckii]APG72384.1 glycosyltransferase [Lactobacillus delbrueckii subsp. jakobsenii ZN7a-9 = DSM 26046]EOD02083.1 glycosyltransferase [Lactobacillus delbrueckii subsp. jakobsenii ZN7a-9 = DSM 26046]KRO17360.1 glycosyltransferase [Lactobacillus delbrueckii subsp. jakobsenii ZN7a-9 = DSM 26046]TDG61947.1 hypothetical protein C5L19_000898 [Lactobacillus delbrueckii subsp. jakobsenii]
MSSLVSVIVPVYNVEKYLTQCIESLIEQSYKNMEILLIDDGSTDSSGKLCDRYAQEYANIFTYHKKNSGLGLTRNYGLERIKGDYVTFVDSDDYLDPEAINQLVCGLDSGKNDTVIGGFTKITDKGKKLYVESYFEKVVNNDNCYSQIFCHMLGSSPVGHDSIKASVWNVLYSTKIIKENNISFVSEREYISEDIVWDSDYFKYSKSVKVISSSLYYYRSNPNSLSKTYRPDRFKRCISFFEYMIDKISKTEIEDEAKLRLTKNLFVNVRSCFALEKGRLFSDIRKNIKNMCNNPVLQRAIKEYPVSELGFKQKFFICMVKNKWSVSLSMLVQCGLIND